MKKFLFIFLIALFILPFKVWALPSEYSSYATMNLDEALTQEQIEHNFKNYKETDDQVVIYLFRGNGCGFCRNFLTYLNSIVPEYGKMFKVVSFEVWYDKQNASLMEDVAKQLNTTVGGVPFIIIGDEVFPGYAEEYNEKIIQAIKKQYESKEKFDVFEEMVKAKNEPETTSTSCQSNKAISIITIVCNILIVVIGAGAIVAVVNKKNNEVLDAIESLEDRLANAGVLISNDEPDIEVKEKNKKVKSK